MARIGEKAEFAFWLEALPVKREAKHIFMHWIEGLRTWA